MLIEIVKTLNICFLTIQQLKQSKLIEPADPKRVQLRDLLTGVLGGFYINPNGCKITI